MTSKPPLNVLAAPPALRPQTGTASSASASTTAARSVGWQALRVGGAARTSNRPRTGPRNTRTCSPVEVRRTEHQIGAFACDESAFGLPVRAIFVACLATFILIVASIISVVYLNVDDQDVGDPAPPDAPRGGPPPDITWQQSNSQATLRVVAIDRDANWQDIHVDGCARPGPGRINAGDQLMDCTGPITIHWIPTSTVIHRTTFP